MSRLEDVSEMSMLLFEQVQDAKSLAIGSTVRCRCKLSCSQIMFLARGHWIRSFRLEEGIADVSMRLENSVSHAGWIIHG